MKFTKIREETFKELQLNAGILLEAFDPSTAALDMKAILAASTGGVEFSAIPSFRDDGEDIDNCPKNMLELKKLDTWDIRLKSNLVTINAAVVQRALGAADVDKTKITPRSDLKTEDFKDLWWVGDYSDKNGESNGGFVAIHMMNTLSTGGYTLKTADKAKGQHTVEFTAHYSINAQTTVPFEVYVQAGTDEADAGTTK